MARSATVLITAVGGIVGQGIMKCLRLVNSKSGLMSYRLVAADASAQAAGLYRGDLGLRVPLVSAAEYIDTVIQLCRKREVEAIFIGSEEELVPLARASERIESEGGAIVVSSNPNVLSLGMDKWETYRFLKANRFACAESALPEDRESFVGEFGFPMVVKPREGHGSESFYVVRTLREIDAACEAITERGWRPMLQEYLSDEGSEFTTGVTVDREGKEAMSSISIRRTLKGGQTYRAFVEDREDVRRSSEAIALRLGARGPVNVQARREGDSVKVFEINPRFSASCPIRAVAGVNEPDIVFRNARFGESIHVDRYEELACFRFWNELFVPLDEYEGAGESGTVEKSGAFVPDYF
jgi:carbamoyl-phosphate synthase large subunit